MKKAQTKTIIQKIQPQCETLYMKIKDEKDRQHKTNQSIAERTGVPISTVAKFLSGSLSNPSIFNVVAICIELGISIDKQFDIASENTEYEPKIYDLEAQLEREKDEVKHLTELNDIYKKGVAERKPVIYGLVALCIILVFALICYVYVDINTPEFGYFQGSNFAKLLLGVLIAAEAVVLTWYITKKKYSIEDGKNE